MLRWILLGLFLCGPAFAQRSLLLGAGGSFSAAPPPAPLAFTALAPGTVGGAAIAGSGTYTGTAPTSISSATWTGCGGGSSTPAGFSAATGTWSATFTVPGSAGAGCTIAITDNRTETATSPGVTISAGAFSGVGDAFPGASFWFGLEAYTAAVAATGTQLSVRLIRPDTVQCDFLIATTGLFGLSTATCNSSTQGGVTPIVFAGTDATGTGSISGTTLTFTGGTVGDPVSGGTTLPGTFIVSGSSPTWTVNKTQTVASATLTLTKALYVTVGYDQSGNGNNCAPNTTPQRLLFVPTGGTSATTPWLAPLGGQGLDCAITGPSQPFTIAAVGIRTGAFTSQVSLAANDAPNFTQFSYGTSANTVFAYAGASTSNVTASDSAWHGLQAIYNGGSSIINVDGSATSSLNAGTNALTGSLGIGAVFGTTTQALTGGITQLGIWPSAATGTQQTNVNAAMHTNGGF